MNERIEQNHPRRRSDGEQTHSAILDQAVQLASIEGVGQITLGRLATITGISKSGVYAHFGSKKQLQAEIIHAAERILYREVIEPALEAHEGYDRLFTLYKSYLSYIEREVFPGGCFFAGLISEFDAQSGEIHELVVAGRRDWDEFVQGLIEDAKSRGELSPSVDSARLAFELDSVTDHANFLYTLYRDRAHIERARVILKDILRRARAATE